MPRRPRVDAPGAAHHVLLRGIERRRIFRDAADHEDFLRRLDHLIPLLGFRCFAWVLMPNHVHLALRTGPVPLSRLMARLGTGYAGYFNRRHDRVGHLFQNRYKSRLVEDESDLLGVVLYIHRNPLRAGLVTGLEALGRLSWCGHGALSGERSPRTFEEPAATLGLLADDLSEARRRLARRMQVSADTDGAAGCAPVRKWEQSRRPATRRALSEPENSLEALIEAVCAAQGVSRRELSCRKCLRRAVSARTELVRRAVNQLGLQSRVVARALGISEAAVSRALARGGEGGDVPSEFST